MNLETA